MPQGIPVLPIPIHISVPISVGDHGPQGILAIPIPMLTSSVHWPPRMEVTDPPRQRAGPACAPPLHEDAGLSSLACADRLFTNPEARLNNPACSYSDCLYC